MDRPLVTKLSTNSRLRCLGAVQDHTTTTLATHAIPTLFSGGLGR